jgi:uncharacterized membrane protein
MSLKMEDRTLSPARLEAISDGIIAVIITIMVLDLRPPAQPSGVGLMSLAPRFAAYMVSYAFIATFWVNHRHAFADLRRVSEAALWSNIVFLFTLSLIPFSTAWVGDSGAAAFPTAIYAVVMLLNGLAYFWLTLSIAAQHPKGEPPAWVAPQRLAGYFAAATYVIAIPAAYVHPALSLALNVAVSVFYATPIPRPRVGN